MNTQNSLFKEYTNRDEALDDVRQMRAEGIEEIETSDLKPRPTKTTTDTDTAPPHKTHVYIASGIAIGATLGFIVSNIIFLIPATLLRISHANLIGGLGVFACTAGCGAIGLAMSFAYSKRTTRRIRRNSASVLAVSVEPENEDQARVARRIMKLGPAFT